MANSAVIWPPDFLARMLVFKKYPISFIDTYLRYKLLVQMGGNIIELPYRECWHLLQDRLEKKLCRDQGMQIVDRGRTKFSLNLKEGLHGQD